MVLGIGADSTPEAPLSTYNLGVTGNHTYTVGRHGICVHNTCPDEEAKRFISVLQKYMEAKGKKILPPEKELQEAMAAARKALHPFLPSSSIRRYAQNLSRKYVEHCANSPGVPTSEMPSWSYWRKYLKGIQKAETGADAIEIHHIVPKTLAETFRGRYNLPVDFHVDRHIPADAMSKASHRDFTDRMNRLMAENSFKELADGETKRILQFYKDENLTDFAQITKKWFDEMGVPINP